MRSATLHPPSVEQAADHALRETMTWRRGSSPSLSLSTPLTPFERKVVHDAVANVKGVESESEGEEPRRQVVVSRSA